MERQFTTFLLRWLVNSFGLWLAGALFSSSIDFNDSLYVVFASGAVLSLVNSILKPIVVVLSLPAILFSLGLFILLVNGFMVYVVSRFVPGFTVDSFGSAILAGIIIGLVNYAITATVEENEFHE